VADRPAGRDFPALVAGLTTVTLWGSAFVGIRAAGHSLSPGSIALGRLLVSSAILSAVALLRRETLPPRSALLPIALFGLLFLGVYSVMLNAAERRVDAGTAAMIVNTGPLLIALLAGFALREGFPRRLLLGCAVALGGCVLIGMATRASAAGGHVGLALLGVATLSYAVAVVVQKVALGRASAFQVTWLGCLVATLACAPFAPALAGEAPGVSAIGWLVYLGAMPTALGFVTWSLALRRATAGRVASLNYLIPVVAISFGWAALGERPPVGAIGGGALCLAGVYVARRSAPQPPLIAAMTSTRERSATGVSSPARSPST
jgi:drug/metabolite transporter (DMT)-like permease